MSNEISKPRLLVVEDNKRIRDHLGDRLGDRYELTFATCQVEAYDLLKTQSFDLVLLDLKLPVQPSGMNDQTEVGIAIIDEIRKRDLRKANSKLPLPIVVMTAYGSEEICTQVSFGKGVNNYIKKPFGTGTDLEDKIAGALLNKAKLIVAGSMEALLVRIAFDDEAELVRIETIPPYRGANYELLRALLQPFLDDEKARRSPDNRTSVQNLPTILRIEEPSVRQRVRKFRRKVKADFESRLGRTIGDNDIIDSARWQGYWLNPVTVRLVAWDELPGDE